MLAPVEQCQEIGHALGRCADGEIAEMPDPVRGLDRLVLALDQAFVHRRDRGEGPAIERERAGMPEMRVAGEEDRHSPPPYRADDARASTCRRAAAITGGRSVARKRDRVPAPARIEHNRESPSVAQRRSRQRLLLQPREPARCRIRHGASAHRVSTRACRPPPIRRLSRFAGHESDSVRPDRQGWRWDPRRHAERGPSAILCRQFPQRGHWRNRPTW
jgi:hypothetical protein